MIYKLFRLSKFQRFESHEAFDKQVLENIHLEVMKV